MTTTDTLQTIAYEMLTSTNVFRKPIADIGYGNKDDKTYLIDIVNELLSNHRSGYRNRSLSNYQIIYNTIARAMIAYLSSYPASFSFKQQTKKQFSLWLEKIEKKYAINDVKVPEELDAENDKSDTGIVMLKALHSRKGITKEKLRCELGDISARAVQKNLRKISPSLYEGNSADIEETYMPFYIGGQPIHAKIRVRVKDEDKEKKKYYDTPNTVHPIILQENLMQVGVLLKSLCINFCDNESDISLNIALDIWSQLSDYAKARIESKFARIDKDMQFFIELLKDSSPDNRACIFQTEREMQKTLKCLFMKP